MTVAFGAFRLLTLINTAYSESAFRHVGLVLHAAAGRRPLVAGYNSFACLGRVQLVLLRTVSSIGTDSRIRYWNRASSSSTGGRDIHDAG